MRIANKFSLTSCNRMVAAYFVAFGFFCIAPAPSYAVDAPQAAGLPVLSSAPPAAAAPAVAPPGIPLTEAPKGQNESIGKNVSALENEITSNAKKLIKRLDVAADATSLADLNSAKQTVTRIEAMIEIEKRLKELDKLRGERDGGGSLPPPVLANALPSSALTPPMSMGAFAQPEMLKSKKPSADSGRPEISHIYGTGGKYTAVLKQASGDLKSVRVGDKVSNGETVQAITASSVEVGGKTPYTLRVKNVDMVYSAMR